MRRLMIILTVILIWSPVYGQIDTLRYETEIRSHGTYYLNEDGEVVDSVFTWIGESQIFNIDENILEIWSSSGIDLDTVIVSTHSDARGYYHLGNIFTLGIESIHLTVFEIPPMLLYEPKEDITAFELAKIISVLLSDPLNNYGLITEHYLDSLQIRRHFKLVKE